MTISFSADEKALTWQGRKLRRITKVVPRKKYEFAVLRFESGEGVVVPWPSPGLTALQWTRYAFSFARERGGEFSSIYYCE